MKCVKAYYSASIRGAAGNDVTDDVVKQNLLLGISRGKEVQSLLGSTLELYIPHAHDRLIQILWRRGCMTDENILMGDMEIIKTCDFMMVDGYLSTGVKVEMDCCEAHSIPIHFLQPNLDNDVLLLHDLINSILHRKYSVDGSTYNG